LRNSLSLAVERGPVEARPIAEEILNLLPDTGDILITVDDTSRYNLNAAVTLSPLTHMWLFTAEGRTGLHYETVFHETLHAYVALKYRTLRDALGRFQNEGETPIEDTATLALAQFARVWGEFRTASANERTIDPQLAIAITDARNNPDEFFVRSLTDSTFQKYLSEKRYEGRTLWSRFKSWLKTNVFGIPKADVAPSWLDAALLASREVAKTLQPRSDQKTGTKTKHADRVPSVELEIENRDADHLRAWMDASSAIDSEGSPILVFHGTRRAFDNFEMHSPRGALGNPAGAYFTADRHVAQRYAENDDGELDEKSRVIAAYIRIRDDEDGKIIDSAYRGREYVIFKPENILVQSANVLRFPSSVETAEASRTRIHEETTEFRSWFGNSKVVDRGGKPLVMYHGSNACFRAFDPDKAGKNFRMGEVGMYFTSSPEQASMYAQHRQDGSPTVYPVYLSLQNPLILEEDAGWGGVLSLIENNKSVKAKVRKAIASGLHDGVIARDMNPGADGEPETVVIALRPEQVKSAFGNSGAFDPESPDMNASRTRVQEFSDEFRAWFGNSKVVDEQGKAIVVYHGTVANFSKFDPKESCDGGFHFGTSEAATARLNYLTEGADDTVQPNVMPAYLSIKNPKQIDYDPFDEDSWAGVIVEAKASGHDGVVYPNSVEGGESWVAFRADQIKSAIGNRGTFDPNDPDISASRNRIHEESENFKAWFANSKAVDASSRPLVLYHGSNADFKVFDLNYSWGGTAGTAFYFGDAETAGRYGGEDGEMGRRVMPVYLSLQNPASDTELDEFEERADRGEFTQDEISSELIKAGFDGVISEYRNIYVAFHPNQIKSAIGNVGSFDPDNPDIMASRRAPINTAHSCIDASYNGTPPEPVSGVGTGCIIEDETGRFNLKKFAPGRRSP
jgi:hypothetical protein